MYATLSRTSREDSDRSDTPGPSPAKGRGAASGLPRFLHADVDRRAAIEFPHASPIQSAIGTSIPGSALYDPDACERRGAPAFTDGSVTHFATPDPGLHVAAHEAAHQLQHSGRTHDAGMGAEGHAHSVANAIVSGASPRPVLGNRGRPVAPALRHYTDIPAATQTTTSQWIIGSDARVADSGRMVTSVADRHVCYADPALIGAADLILRAKQSGVRLRAGGAGPSGPAPDGSGDKSTVEVIPQVRSMTSNGEVWTDCGRMSREVQGVAGTDTPARGFYQDSAGTQRETTPGVPTQIRDEALVGAGLGADPTSARAAYDAMYAAAHATPADPAAIAALDAFERAHGINRYAAPNVGESYMSVRNDALTQAGYNFHWGGVVMVSGGDRVTFENFARYGTGYDTKNNLWYFDMYGPPAKAGQTWHDRWAEGTGREGTGVGEPGKESMTFPSRTSADPSPWTPGTPAMTICELVTRRAAATQEGERMALDAELRTRPVVTTGQLIRCRAAATHPGEINALDAEMRKRWIKVTVKVVSAQEGPDDVYVHAEHGGRSHDTDALSMGAGDSNTFWIPLSAFLPVTGAIEVRVYESDWGPDDMISLLDLEDRPRTDNSPFDDAEYHTTAEFDR